jgi:hypothetical protein
LNKALDTLGLNTKYEGANLLTELFTSVLQARQITKLDTPALKPIDIQPQVYPDSCAEMSNKTYETLVNPMRKDKYWFSHLYRYYSDRFFLLDAISPINQKQDYYHLKVFRRPCFVQIKPINID